MKFETEITSRLFIIESEDFDYKDYCESQQGL